MLNYCLISFYCLKNNCSKKTVKKQTFEKKFVKNHLLKPIITE